jgi:hypothetical protein
MFKSEVKEKEVKEIKEINAEKEKEYFIEQLSPLEKHALEIAKRQLKTSFDLEKSIGFLKFKST